MDFLRSCTTNVQPIFSDPNARIAYVSYRLSDTTAAEIADQPSNETKLNNPGQELTNIAAAQEDGQLCYTDRVRNRLWLFRTVGKKTGSAISESLDVVEEGYIDTAELIRAVKEHNISTQDPAYVSFLQALSTLISNALRANANVSLIGPMTWLLTPREHPATPYLPGEEPVDLTSSSAVVRVSLRSVSDGRCICTYEAKAINAQLATTFTGLSSHLVEGRSVTMAPAGVHGTCLKSVVLRPDTPGLDEARQWLEQHYGFLKLYRDWQEPETWLLIRLAVADSRLDGPSMAGTRPGTILWPSCLCLVAAVDEADLDDTDPNAQGFDWTASGYEDPFRLAEEWYLGKDQRSSAERQRLQRSDNEVNGWTDQDANLSASPIYQRNLEPNTANGVYPTPPDGVVGAQNAPTSSSLNNTDTFDDEDTMMRSSPASARQVPTIEIDGQSLNEDESDLFGEVDEDMFEGPDVTDADFNFFDQATAARLSASRQLTPSRTQTDQAVVAQVVNGQEHDQAKAGVEVESQAPGDLAAAMSEQHADFLSTEDTQQSDGQHDNTAIDDRSETAPFQAEAQTQATTPPLSPVLVKDRLQTSLSDATRRSDNNPSDSFIPVRFDPSAANSGSKYSAGGRYGEKLYLTMTSTPPLKRSASLRAFLESGKHKDTTSGRQPFDFLSNSHKLAIDVDDDTDSIMSIDSWNEPPTKVRIWHDDTVDRAKQSRGNEPYRTANPDSAGPGLRGFEDIVADWDCLETWRKAVTTNSINVFELLPSRPCLRPETEEGTFWDLFAFDGSDMITVAQHLSQQNMVDLSMSTEISFEQTVSTATSLIREDCALAISRYASTKVLTLPALTIMSVNAAASNADSAKTGPRPVPRRSGSHYGGNPIGHHLMPLFAPFIRLRRSDTGLDLLSSALAFWQTMNLEPSNGRKNVIADFVSVGSEDLGSVCAEILTNIQSTYEACKLGKHTAGIRIHKLVEDGILLEDKRSTAPAVLNTLRQACIELAQKIMTRYRNDSQTPTVVYLCNPFLDSQMTKFICACFQACCRLLDLSVNRVILRIIPLAELVKSGRLLIADAGWLTKLCLSTYDNLPPPPNGEGHKLWGAFSAPSVTLVNTLPRKINFSLSETPPTNLMQEAQIMHLAYCIGADGDWLNCAWTDYSGNHQISKAYCLRKTDKDAVFTAVKDFTLSLMTPTTTWRLTVACVGHTTPVERSLWTDVASKTIAVAVVDITLSSPIQIFSQALEPAPTTDTNTATPATPTLPQTALTPVSTPQAFNTVSPDAHHPPTPSSVEHNTPAAQTEAPPDPDAQLIDTRDESYGLILPFAAGQPGPSTFSEQGKVLASGLLLKRGDAVPGQALPSLGVDVVEVVPPRIPQGQSSWLMPRSPEYVLREVLAWYRGLGLLGKVRNVRGCGRGEVPWHVGVAVAGARSLEGFFD